MIHRRSLCIRSFDFRFSLAIVFVVGVLAMLRSDVSAQLIYDDGAEHTLDIQSGDDLDVFVRGGSHLNLTGQPNAELDIVIEASTIQDLRPEIEGSFRLTEGSTHTIIGGDGTEGRPIISNMDVTMSESRMDFRGTIYVEDEIVIDSTRKSNVNFVGATVWQVFGAFEFRGMTQVNVSENAAFRVWWIYATDDVQGNVSDSAVSSLVLDSNSRFSISDSRLVESNFDDLWQQGYVQLSDNATLDAERVEFIREKGCCSPLFHLKQNSRLSLTDGTALGGRFDGSDAIAFKTEGNSQVELVDSEIEVRYVDMGSSSAALYYGIDSSTIDVRGGDYSINAFYPIGDAVAAIVHGGGESRISIDGGTYKLHSFAEQPTDWSPHIALAEENATIEIRDGSFNVSLGFDSPGEEPFSIVHLMAADSGTITVSGVDFNYPLGDIADLDGTLTGTLNSGEVISWNFSRAESARIVLVPEPQTFMPWLIAIGIWGYTRKHG